MEYFGDELGALEVYSTYVERKREDEELWKEIEDKIEGFVIDRIHYSEIEKISCQSESAPPLIEIKVRGGWRKMPFSNAEACMKAFKRLKYHFNVFKENY